MRAVFFAFALLAGCVISAQAQYKSVAEAVIATPDLSTLLGAVAAANLTSVLADETLVATVFAPTNAAFAAAANSSVVPLDQVLANPALLTQVLTYHVVPGVAAASSSLVNNQKLTTLEGSPLYIKLGNNGAVTVQGLQNAAKVVTADVDAGESIVHIIDGVLYPPMRYESVPALLQANNLNILLAAVQAANLTDTLSSPDLVATILAPTDAAFAALLADLNLTAEQLLGNTELLTSVLAYHVVPGVAATSYDLTRNQKLVTLLGPTPRLTVSKKGGGVRIVSNAGPEGNVANVVTPNLLVPATGEPKVVVHVIDEVLLPIKP